jgi:hypothetical protein
MVIENETTRKSRIQTTLAPALDSHFLGPWNRTSILVWD